MKIAVLILAAGRGSRMGKIKQLLPFQESTLLEHAVNQANQSKANNVFCVLGANSDLIEDQIKSTGVTFIKNEHWESGLSSSIIAGISHIETLKELPDAVLIMLSDQPFVSSNYINTLINMYLKNVNSIIASDYGGVKGVPAIFPNIYFKTLLEIKGDKGAKALLNRTDLKVKTVFPKHKNTLQDIDTPEDYKGLFKSNT